MAHMNCNFYESRIDFSSKKIMPVVMTLIAIDVDMSSFDCTCNPGSFSFFFAKVQIFATLQQKLNHKEIFKKLDDDDDGDNDLFCGMID